MIWISLFPVLLLYQRVWFRTHKEFKHPNAKSSEKYLILHSIYPMKTYTVTLIFPLLMTQSYPTRYLVFTNLNRSVSTLYVARSGSGPKINRSTDDSAKTVVQPKSSYSTQILFFLILYYSSVLCCLSPGPAKTNYKWKFYSGSCPKFYQDVNNKHIIL